MSLIQYIKLKLRRTNNNSINDIILDQGELVLNKDTKELKIGTSENGENWENATSLNRLRKIKDNDNFQIQPGEMVYKNNQLKINTSNTPQSWDQSISLNHIKTHQNGDNPKLEIGELSFNVDTGELLIQGINNKTFRVNRIPLVDSLNQYPEKELIYNITNERFEIKDDENNIIFNKTIPIFAPNNESITPYKKLYKNDKIYYFSNEDGNPLNGIYITGQNDNNFIPTHYPISNLKYDISDNKLSYQMNDIEITMNKAITITYKQQNESTDENGDIVYSYVYEPDTIYSPGTIIYDNQRKCLLIGDGTSPLSNLNPLSGGNATTIGISFNEFGDGNLT